MISVNIVCVVVTYNRLAKLKKALACYACQTMAPQRMIIVDNASAQDTAAYLQMWLQQKESYDKQVIHLPKNIGGSGGFYAGMQAALQIGAKWVFVADDDAYPEPDVIEGMDKKCQEILEDATSNVSVLCTSVVCDGEIDNLHRKFLKNYIFFLREARLGKENYTLDSIDIDSFSYVGAAISRQTLKSIGLPLKEYFIYYDDFEHAIRCRKAGRIVCLPQLKMIHDSDPGRVPMGVDWRKYYFVRNKINCYLRYYKLAGIAAIIVEVAQAFVKLVFMGNVKECKMRLIAVIDGAVDRLGIHPIYRP